MNMYPQQLSFDDGSIARRQDGGRWIELRTPNGPSLSKAGEFVAGQDSHSKDLANRRTFEEIG